MISTKQLHYLHTAANAVIISEIFSANVVKINRYKKGRNGIHQTSHIVKSFGGITMQISYNTQAEAESIVNLLETRIRKLELDIEVIKYYRNKQYENNNLNTNRAVWEVTPAV